MFLFFVYSIYQSFDWGNLYSPLIVSIGAVHSAQCHPNAIPVAVAVVQTKSVPIAIPRRMSIAPLQHVVCEKRADKDNDRAVHLSEAAVLLADDCSASEPPPHRYP